MLPADRISPMRDAAASIDSGARSARSSMVRHQRDKAGPAPRSRRATAAEMIVAAVAYAPAWRQMFGAGVVSLVSWAIPSLVAACLLSPPTPTQHGPHS